MNLNQVWTLVSSQGFSKMYPSGLECSTSISVSSNTHPATCCCFIYIFKMKSSFPKHPNSRNAAGTRTRLHLFYAGPHMFVSQPIADIGNAECRAGAGNIWRRGCCSCWHLGGWYLGGGKGLSCRECRFSVLIKEDVHFFCCHSVLLAGSNN